MSAKAIAWAFGVRDLTATTRNVLFVLADSADKFGRCWPSINTLAHCAEVSRRTAQYAVRQLEERELIMRLPRSDEDNGRTTSTLYWLHPEAREFKTEASVPDVGEGATIARGGADSARGEGATVARGRVHTAAPLKLLEPPEGRESKAETSPTPENPTGDVSSQAASRSTTTPLPIAPLPGWLPREAWDAFEADRRERRQPITTRARTLLMRRLLKLHDEGQDLTAVLEQSIEKRWTGVFPVKPDRDVRPREAEDDSWKARVL